MNNQSKLLIMMKLLLVRNRKEYKKIKRQNYDEYTDIQARQLLRKNTNACMKLIYNKVLKKKYGLTDIREYYSFRLGLRFIYSQDKVI